MTRVLLTGIGGFIGGHCLEYFLEHTDWFIVGLDSFKHKGTYSRIFTSDRVKILKHDLSVPIDSALENQIMDRRINDRGQVEETKLDYIINMASDSAVERSITDPGYCWRNNCELAFNMLELARRVKPKIYFQCSTDEVYGDCPEGYSHPEWDTILPSNTYSASKAAQEALSISYWRTYDVPVVLTNCVNCIGIRQDKEKFLPKLIWKIATNQEMEIYADGDKIGTRYYLHCENHADVFKFLADRPVSMYNLMVRPASCESSVKHYNLGDYQPDRYNVTGDVELNNLEMAQLVADLMGKKLHYRLIPSESARKGYDRRYALDGSKLKKMGWEPPVKFREGLEKIIKWTLEHQQWII